MAPRDWRYSRKTPGRYNAIGGFRMWREPLKDQVVLGLVLGTTNNAWRVRLSGEEHVRLVSRKHATMLEQVECESPGQWARFSIPGWLWAKMNEGER